MMNGMFTDRVKKVMQIAREEAIRLGNDYVGTEHLLLGLIKEGDGVAVAVMRSMGVDLEDCAATIEKTITSSGGMMTIGQMLPFTPRAKKVLEIAANPPYNAKGDCSTDDHNAIQAAMTTAASYSPPAVVYFPKSPGACYLTSTLTWNGASFQGQAPLGVNPPTGTAGVILQWNAGGRNTSSCTRPQHSIDSRSER